MDTKQTFFDNLEPEVVERLTSRREALRKAGKFGAGLALASVPVALGVLSRSAFGQALPQQVIDVLNFALTLEYLEAEYYNTGLATAALIPAEATDVYAQIAKHENAHVALLQSVLGVQAVAKPTFDFTAGGTFDPFGDYGTFLALSQGFEDTGVRAYKGQAGNLIGADAILTVALQIHSVEARHAAMVRRLRGVHSGNAQPEAWIEFDNTNVPALAPVYAGEENITHLGINVKNVSNRSIESITEAWDEPLSTQAVLDIAGLFIA